MVAFGFFVDSKHVLLEFLHGIVVVVSSDVEGPDARSFPLLGEYFYGLNGALLIASVIHHEQNVLEALGFQAGSHIDERVLVSIVGENDAAGARRGLWISGRHANHRRAESIAKLASDFLANES